MAKQTKPTANEQEATTAVAPAKPAELIKSDIAGVKPVKDRKNRQTGTQIQLYKPVDANHTWVTGCATHNVWVHSTKRKDANALRYTPTQWCEGCAKLVKERAQKEAEAKAAQAEAK